MSEKEIVILGGGGHATSVADVILRSKESPSLTFIDPNAQEGKEIFGFRVVSEVESDEDSKDKEYFVAIGDNERRRAVSEQLGNVSLTEIIAIDAHVGHEAKIGRGSFLGHEAYVGPQANIGDNCIINTRAIVEHNVTIGNHSQVAPGAIIGGNTSIGENVFIGLGSRVIDGLTICSNVIVGAGAVVVKDIDEPGTYVGIPARKSNG